MQELKDKLRQLDANDQLRLLYMWIKQGHINLKQFIELSQQTGDDIAKEHQSQRSIDGEW